MLSPPPCAAGSGLATVEAIGPTSVSIGPDSTALKVGHWGDDLGTNPLVAAAV